MTRWFQLDASPSRRLLPVVVLGVLAWAGSLPGLRAQTAGESSPEIAVPAVAAPAAPTFVPRFGSAAPFGDAAPTSGYTAISPFKPSFDASRDLRFGAPRQNPANSNPFATFSPGVRRESSASLFAPNGRQTNPLDRMTTPIELPSLTQVLQKGTTPTLGVYSPRTFNQNAARIGGLFDDNGTHFASSTMFANSDLGNGVRFSAGTDFGSHRAAGAPAAGFGPSVGKTSGPSVAFKLSF